MARGETITMSKQVRYSRYMQLRMEEVRLHQEHEEWKEILHNLNPPQGTPPYQTPYASHKKTAMVYDIDALNDKLMDIDNRLKEINEELDEKR